MYVNTNQKFFLIFDSFNFEGLESCFTAAGPASALDDGICRIDCEGCPDKNKCGYPRYQYRFVIDKDAKHETKRGRYILDEAYRS